MKHRMFAVLLLAVTAAPLSASDKGQREYVMSKLDSLALECQGVLVNGAKDPDSVRLPATYDYTFGRGLTKNWVTLTFDVIGRNSYGAVLRRTVQCSYSCDPEKGCTFKGIFEH